jgi:hypothetical protein
MEETLRNKANEIRSALHHLGEKLESGDDSSIIVWVIAGKLACAHRPLRHHPNFGGSGKDLPPAARGQVFAWARRLRDSGIKGIISLMHPKELRHYEAVDLGATDLIAFYEKEGFRVCHIPWEDPAHRLPSQRLSFQEELARVRVESLTAFDKLPKPVLLHCSAGIDRSAPVAAFIFLHRSSE